MRILLTIITIAVIVDSIILAILANLIDKNMRMFVKYEIQLKLVFTLLEIIVVNVIGAAVYCIILA